MNTNDDLEWFDIPVFNGIYKISRCGLVKSVDRWVGCNGGKVLVKEQIMKQHLDRAGYLRVMLSMNNKQKGFFIHRLLAEVFIPNQFPDVQKVVRHLNDKPLDNRIENLAWGTQKDNAQDSIRNGTFAFAKKGSENPLYGKKTGRIPPNKGTKGLNTKLILDLQTGIFYNGTEEAAFALGMNANTLRAKMTGHIKKQVPLIYV